MTEETILDQIATEHIEMSDLALRVIQDRGIAEFLAGALMQHTDGNIGGILPLMLQTIHNLCGYDKINSDIPDFLGKLIAVYKNGETIAAQVQAEGETKQ